MSLHPELNPFIQKITVPSTLSIIFRPSNKNHEHSETNGSMVFLPTRFINARERTGYSNSLPTLW